ncbi:unnamed protein product [Linum trigynum]|uniref:Non-specific serine/threonine protein kinase n=1 Tax=Linum trigynum TaxID=586398 RepID=A0AAV2CI08_9ROSI
MISLLLLKTLIHLDLSYNQLAGDIPAHWEGFQKFEYVDLIHNSFSGSIPLSLFSISSLQKIYLSFNQLKDQALDFSYVASLVLDTLDLSGNNLEGLILRSIFGLGTLKVLLLSSNRFTATVPLKWFQSL